MNERYGVFELGGMQLALHLDAMRELVPARAMIQVPCAGAGMIGAVDVRGILLPVIDLRVTLGMQPTANESPPASIVVMSHAGRLLGMAAHDCGGVFECGPDRLSQISAQSGTSILAGGFARPDDGSLVSLISPAAVLALPNVPSVEDSRRDEALLEKGMAPLQPTERHTMLFRCAGLPMAIESEVVFTTILKPEIKPSPAAQGYCMGMVEYGGLNIPAVDLARLCTLDRTVDGMYEQAFLVRYAGGLLAFMVDEIMDVINANVGRLRPVPDSALRLSRFFSGMLPLEDLPAHIQERVPDSAGYFLMLDGAEIAGYSQLKELSGVITPAQGGLQAIVLPELDDRAVQAERRQILSYDLGFEAATPIDQFTEILPWSGVPVAPVGDDNSRGLVMRHGRAIPVFCLPRLLGLTPPPPTATASILVVESAGRLIGFVVAGLFTIDDAPAAKLDFSRQVEDASSILSADYRDCWARVMIGSGSSERMRGVLNLRRVAESLLESVPAEAA